MNRLRNVFKKNNRKDKEDESPAAREKARRERVRRSQSMPFRNSSDTDDSYRRARPAYRGQHPLKPSDIHMVFDISAEAGAKYENPSWPKNGADQRSEDEYGGPYCRREDLIDKDMLDMFPSPPGNSTHTPTELAPPPTRPATRPPPTDVESIIIPDDLLPPITDKFSAYLCRLKEEELAERGRERTISGKTLASIDVPPTTRTHGRPTVQRSNSSASFSQPTRNAYPNYLHMHALARPTTHGRSATYPPTHDPRAQTTYVPTPSITTHPNFSTQSLGADAYLRSGPVARRAVHQPTPAPGVAAVVIEPLRPRKTSKSSVTSARTVDTGFYRNHARPSDWPAASARERLQSNPAHPSSFEQGYVHRQHNLPLGRYQVSTYSGRSAQAFRH